MKKKCIALILLILFCLGITGCQPQPAGSSSAQAEQPSSALEVHFLNVGQGDCAFIRQGEKTMLIDAGNGKDGPAIVEYLRQQQVNALDYVVATHPHADHIGGMAAVLEAFPAEQILLPKVSHTSKTFEHLLDTIEKKGLTITAAKADSTYPLGDAFFTILSPRQKTYPDLNHYSIVLTLHHGDNAFLFAGDAEQSNEEEMLASCALSATVLKVGHHGSSTSSSAAFLQQVRPAYAVISAGANNAYGHPHQQVLDRLAALQVQVYRTDQQGNIVMRSDKRTLIIETE